jgi:hypothetical protein
VTHKIHGFKEESFFRLERKSLFFAIGSRVARWFVFKPKIPILVKYGMENVVIFYDHL